MEIKQIGIIVVTIFTLTSIVGFAVLQGSSYNQNKDSVGVPDIQNQQQPKTITFQAKKLEAQIDKFLPSIKVIGVSNEPNLKKTSEKISNISGVLGIRNTFFNQDPSSKTLLYNAELSIKQESFDEITSQIRGFEEFSRVEFARKALLKLPSTIKIKNTALELERDFTFSEPFSEAVVLVSSQEGDFLMVDLSLTLQGEKLLDIEAFQVDNLSLKKAPHNPLNISSQLLDLNKSIVFSGKKSYTGFDLNKIEKDLNSIKNVKSSIVEVNFKNSIFTVNFIKDENRDLNKLKGTLMSLSSLRFLGLEEKENNVVSLNFAPVKKFNSFKKQATVLLSDLNIEDLNFINPNVLFLGEIILFSNESSVKTTKEISKVLNSYNLTGFDFRQTANIELKEIFDSDLNKNYVIDSNKVSALVKPGHSIEDEINFTLRYFTQRNKVSTAQAIEIEKK